MPVIREKKATDPNKMDSKKLMQNQKKILTSPLPFASTILFFLTLFSFRMSAESNSQSIDELRKSVVQIRVFSQSKDPYSPWMSSGISASTGSGFIISKNRILTNAHVVSNAKFIETQRNNQTEWFEVKVLYIAHDCDLAILEVPDQNFYTDSMELELGGLPELASPVDIIGYPIGGSKISVSRGIVSRIEQSSYAHSQIDSHLVVQVDAAINPGNSGGPAFQNGKVVGVAFQASTKGENIGYIIPTNVIQHFLKDIEDGEYDGYVELGIQTQNSFSESHRNFYEIPNGEEGVFVTRVYKQGSADGFLQPGDYLTTIDGRKIGRNGNLKETNSIDFLEVIDNKFAGEEIQFDLIRKKKKIRVSFPAKKMPQMENQRSRYGTDYPYLLLGGLVFQSVNRDLLESWSKIGQTQGGSLLVYRFYEGSNLLDGETEDIVLYRKLPHPTNSHSDFYLNMVVESFNGTKVRNLNHFKNLVQSSKDKTYKIYFYGIQVPMILDREESEKADEQIKRTNHIKGK
ncbi:serine protease [Leptospira levettii]|uniref:Serine protease n=2 Tax=Leptospira levettii TaxID=2023178 RepID=A0ABY2MSS9_9LEPT|nr:S1C family serine protease [Leptospira levettii]PKA28087.1 serine protease [Leptospira sp. mixed culture ATI2-C-A1]MCW7473253.1 serine protease [Leptospira levettii]MCW7513187.1 serine protease [Leptospira levettii]PJZ36306.1 serine protease [Leptospira levettii]PJZ88791.1 serine protease [Leptospira levettii]